MSSSKENFIGAFRDSGYRLTRQREKVFEVLAKASREGRHPSARQVLQELKSKDEDISVATVYNTMGSLVRLGLIKVIEFESGDNRYETNLEPHVNLICSDCGSIQDLHVGPSIHTECARERLGFVVTDFRLEYYGRCAECIARPGDA